MREILFRGKRVDNSEWVYGSFTPSMNARSYITTDRICTYDASIVFADNDQYATFAKVNEETIGQYTGLTDKNGKKIFEGDILRIRGDKEHPVLIVFLDFGWVCVMERYKHYRHRLENNSEKYEVIGNIHDNPELLQHSKGTKEE